MNSLLTGHDLSPLRQVPGEEGHMLHRDVLSHYTLMREAAALAGIQLRLVSSWRSYDKQLSIWNRKFEGELPLLDAQSQVLDPNSLNAQEKWDAILQWSALPGTSRHHWGCDFDVYDAQAMDLADVQLIPEEYQEGGPMEALGSWLKHWLNSPDNPGFYLPYSSLRPHADVGYGHEPWHLSYAPLAQQLLEDFSSVQLQEKLREQPPLGFSENQRRLEEIYNHYVLNTSPAPISGRVTESLQAPLETPAKQLETLPIGHSTQGVPIEVLCQDSFQEVQLLIIASQHGDETEGVQIIARALQQIGLSSDELSPCIAIISPLNPDGLSLGIRANSRSVDLNRNFPTHNWSPELVGVREHADAPRVPTWSPGSHPGSEVETQVLLEYIQSVQPQLILSIHSALACIDEDMKQDETHPLSQWLHRTSGLPITRDIGYPTPGSFGTWCLEQDIPLITLELDALPREELYQKWVPIFTQLLSSKGLTWF